MSDGLWNAGVLQESFRQGDFLRHRLLRVNLGAIPLYVGDASGYAAYSPDSFSIPPDLDLENNLGPHFTMSPETSDGKPTTGFMWSLHQDGIVAGQRATVPVGGFDVTIWVLVENMMLPIQSAGSAGTNPSWASFAVATGVGLAEQYRSFDVNTCAIRFQIEDPGDIGASGSVLIAFCEL